MLYWCLQLGESLSTSDCVCSACVLPPALFLSHIHTSPLTGLHNAVMRRSAAAHAGHVIEQEGDSWSVAFHSAMDAVAFCLQVMMRQIKGSSNSSRWYLATCALPSLLQALQFGVAFEVMGHSNCSETARKV